MCIYYICREGYYTSFLLPIEIEFAKHGVLPLQTIFWGEKFGFVCVKCRRFPGGSVVKNLPANSGAAGVMGSIPASGRSPGGGNCNPLQYSCLDNHMDRGAWRAAIHGVTKKSDTTECLSTCVCTYVKCTSEYFLFSQLGIDNSILKILIILYLQLKI